METKIDNYQKLQKFNEIIVDMYKHSIVLSKAFTIMGYGSWGKAFLDIRQQIANVGKEVIEYTEDANIDIDFEEILKGATNECLGKSGPSATGEC